MRCVFISSVLVGILVAASMIPARANSPESPDPDVVVQAFEAIGGVNPGQRRNHVKGVCVAGSFAPTPQAASLSRSTLFSSQNTPVVGRFSLAGPKAAAPDTAKSPRGLALQFRLPQDELHQTAMLNTPVFGAASPQSFYDKLVAEAPDSKTGKPDPEKLRHYKATYPDSAAQGEYLATHNPPPSYANAAYYSLNAFKVIDANGQERWIKWRFEPKDGVEFLSDADLETLPKDFLVERLQSRVSKGPIQWDMVMTLGQDGDPLDNPSLAWPDARDEVTVGTLSLTAVGGQDCEGVNFDPNILSDGFEASPDAVLAFRSPAYAVSFVKRSAEAAEKP